VSGRAELFLGIIAFATLATAIVQIGVLVLAGLLARRLQLLVQHLDEELRPILGHVQAIVRDVSRAASVATAQVERLDRALTDLTGRLDRILAMVQGFFGGPVGKTRAWMAGFKAIFNLLRDLRTARAGSRADDEDALFI
jgi:hypothetical protein